MLVIDFLINVYATTTTVILGSVVRFVRRLLANGFGRSKTGCLCLLCPIVNVLLTNLFMGCVMQSSVDRKIAGVLCTVSRQGDHVGPRGT